MRPRTDVGDTPMVRRWNWKDIGKPPQPGAIIRRHVFVFFIPKNHLRTVADALHDIADDYEKEKQQ